MKSKSWIISIFCAIAIILSCTVTVSADDATVTVTMNNNGTITQQTLKPGDDMPHPGRNERGEIFFGWYMDYLTWSDASKVTEVPDHDVTVYARYPSVIIDFKQIDSNYFSGALHKVSATATVADGKVTFTTTGNYQGIVVPSYDVKYDASAVGATSQAFRATAGKTYEIRLIGTTYKTFSQVTIRNTLASSPNKYWNGWIGGQGLQYIHSWVNSDYGYDQNPRPITCLDGYDAFFINSGGAGAGTLTIDKIVIIDQDLLKISQDFDANSDPLVAVEHDDTHILNAVTNVATVAEDDLETLLNGDVKPNSVLVKYDGAITADDLDQLYSKCKGNDVIPGLYVSTAEEKAVIVNWCNAKDFFDLTIASDDGELLKSIRASLSALRTVLCVDDTTGKTAQQLRESVRASAATTLMIPAEQSTKELVSDLQALHVTVWSMGTGIDKVDASWMISSGANGVVSDNHVLVNTVMKDVYGENTLTKTPSVIGHRGNPSQAPKILLKVFLLPFRTV